MDRKILEARKAAGLTRQQVTDLLLIPARTLQNWESGERRASAWAEKLVCEKLLQIAREQDEHVQSAHRRPHIQLPSFPTINIFFVRRNFIESFYQAEIMMIHSISFSVYAPIPTTSNA